MAMHRRIVLPDLRWPPRIWCGSWSVMGRSVFLHARCESIRVQQGLLRISANAHFRVQGVPVLLEQHEPSTHACPGSQAAVLFGHSNVRSCTFVACGGTEFPVRLNSRAHCRPDFEYTATGMPRAAVSNSHPAQQPQQLQHGDAALCGASSTLEAAGGWALLASVLRLQPGCCLGVRAAPYTDRLSVWEVRHPPQPSLPPPPAKPPSAPPAPASKRPLASYVCGSLQPSPCRPTLEPGPMPPAFVAPACGSRRPSSSSQQLMHRQAAVRPHSTTDTFDTSYLQLGSQLLQQTCIAALKRSSASLLQPGRPAATGAGKLTPGRRRPRYSLCTLEVSLQEFAQICPAQWLRSWCCLLETPGSKSRACSQDAQRGQTA
jgi:hypothetical protein